jgi:hypothetical protein
VCIAQDETEAEALEREASSYLLLATRLIPPWSTTTKLNPNQLRARQTYTKLLDANHRLQRRPTTDWKKEVFSKQNIDTSVWDKYQQELEQSRRDAVKKAVDELRREGEPSVDLEMIRLYEAWSLPPEQEEADENLKRFDRLVERMGALPKEADKVHAGADRESARFGRVTRTGLLLRFDSLGFKSVGDGLPALAEWLCSKQCVAIKYRLRPLPAPPVRPAKPVDLNEED